MTAVAVLLAASAARADEPCMYDDGGLGAGLGVERVKPLACDAAEIDMERACHCRSDKDEGTKWGSTAGLSLEMTKAARVASGGTVSLPFALVYKGEKPITLDFPGGAVVYVDEVLRGGKAVSMAPCGELRARPREVRLTLNPGAKVRSKMTWLASTSQLASCRDLAKDLPAGRYTLRFETVSGEPTLKASVDVTVTKR
jgi:hypothetical protein